MTGESMAVSKHLLEDKFSGSGFAPNILLRATTIEQGVGEGRVGGRRCNRDRKDNTPSLGASLRIKPHWRCS